MGDKPTVADNSSPPPLLGEGATPRSPLLAPRSPLLLTRLIGFARALRAEGLNVSPAEVIDALRAVTLAPQILHQRETLEAALAGTLVKRAADRTRFSAVFTAYFFGESQTEQPHQHTHEHEDGEIVGVDVAPHPSLFADAGAPQHEHGRRIDLRRFFGEGDATAAGHDHHAGDRLRLTWLGRDTVFDRAGGLPPGAARWEGSFSLRRLSTAGPPGALQPSLDAIELPRDVVLRGLGDLSLGAHGHDPDQDLLALVEKIAAGMRLTPSVLADDSAELSRPLDTEPPELPDLGWDALTADDLRRLDRAIVRLGRKLGGAPGHRHPSRTGRLDGPATMRRAAATDGIPFSPVFQARTLDRPRLVVLCDASLSVRGAARFLLHVSRAAQRQTGRVRTFAYVRDIAEVTAMLERGNVQDAVAGVFGGKILDAAEASDGGAALGVFLVRHGGLLTTRTTILILGDGRNNGRDPNVEALAQLRRRCRRLIWLTPESRGSWRLGGCDLLRYAPHCDVLASVRTPADLERLAARAWG